MTSTRVLRRLRIGALAGTTFEALDPVAAIGLASYLVTGAWLRGKTAQTPMADLLPKADIESVAQEGQLWAVAAGLKLRNEWLVWAHSGR